MGRVESQEKERRENSGLLPVCQNVKVGEGTPRSVQDGGMGSRQQDVRPPRGRPAPRRLALH